MRNSRLIIVAVGMLAGAFAASAIGVTPASAVRTREVRVTKTQPAKETLGPIPANGAGASTAPTGCGHPLGLNRFERTCDNVPFVIEDPQLGPTEDYYVTINVTWVPSEEVDKEAGVNDIDIYLYDDRQIRARKDKVCATEKGTTGEDGISCFTRLGTSGNLVQPETIKLFSPEPLVNYNLVVVNYYGPNISYTIEADIKLESFDAPFEDLGPTFAPRKSGGQKKDAETPDESFAAPADLSGDEPPSSGGSGSGRNAFDDAGDASFADVPGILSGGRTLDEVPILPDGDFGAGGAGATDEFAAPRALGGGGATRLVRAAGPVSGILVAFWMLFVPLALFAFVVFWLRRRNRDAFAFA